MKKEDKLYIVMLSKLVEELIHPTPPNPNLNTERTQREEQGLPEKQQKPNPKECSEINQEKDESQEKKQDTSLEKEQIYRIDIGKACLFFTNSTMSIEDPKTDQDQEKDQEKDEAHDKEQDSSLKKEQIYRIDISEARLFFTNSTMSIEDPKTDQDQEKDEAHDKEQDTSLKEKQIYISAISAIGKAWLFFANSIMSGEFLSYASYSDKLNDMITSIRSYDDKSTDGDPSNPTPYLHPVLATIHDLCFKLRTLCMLMSIQIEVVKEKESVLAISSPLPPQWSSTNSEGNEISRLVDWLRRLVEGLIEMTEIDFTCHTNEAKIKSLHALFDLCKQTPKITALNRTKTPFTEAPLADGRRIKIDYGEALLNAIRCKCSLLAYQSIIKIRQRKEAISSSFSASEPLSVWNEFKYKYRGEEVPYQAVEKALFITNGGCDSALDLSSDNESLVGFWKEKLRHHSYESISSDKREHIIQYDGYITESQEIREYYSKAVTKIREAALDIEALCDIINETIGTPKGKTYGDPPFEFLLTCMRAIEGIEIKKKDDDYKDYHIRVELLGNLLLRLHELKTKYKHINQPYEQTRTFEESFFTDGSERPIPFFIASLGCKYIDTNYLDDRDAYYNRLLRQYRVQESEALSKHHGQETKKAISDERAKNASDLKEQQRDYLTLLGIFSALITLAVSLVTTFKLAETIWDYMAMLGGAYVLIGILVIVLYLRNSDEESDKNSDKKEGTSTIALMKNSMIVAAIIGTLGVGVKGYKEIFPSPKSEKDASNEDVYKAGTINQVHIGIPREESAASPRHSQMLKTNTDSLATGRDSKEARLGESKVK